LTKNKLKDTISNPAAGAAFRISYKTPHSKKYTCRPPRRTQSNLNPKEEFPMRSVWYLLAPFLAGALLCSVVSAQQVMSSVQAAEQTIVPRLVSFSGRATGPEGKTISGPASVTFAIYRDQAEGSPLWLETQNVMADGKGTYGVQLGATQPGGLPLDLFSSGDARWMGVRVNGGEEQPRVLLLSVPYALKAADAETLGGLPASAFMRAAPTVPVVAGSVSVSATAAPSTGVTGTGSAGAIPVWDSASNITSSIMTQTGTGSTARIGINNPTPFATLDVKGSSDFRGNTSLLASGVATATAGKISYPLNFSTVAFNSRSAASVTQTFRWQAEPVGNNSAAASGSFNLLFGSGTSAPKETGLRVGSSGQIAFAAGQTFPGTGSVTSVGLTAPTSDFTVSGSPITGKGNLALTWSVLPSPFNTASAIVKRDANGSFSAGAITAALGLTGNSATGAAGVTGGNTGIGIGAYGVASGTSGQGVYGESFATGNDSSGNGPDGVHGVTHGNLGAGVAGLSLGAAGLGIYGQGGGTGIYGTGNEIGVEGSGGIGVYGTGSTGVSGTSSSGTGVSGTSSSGHAFVANGDASQSRTGGGWVKGMMFVNGLNAPYKIVRCFNSTLTGPAATTPPCGFTLTEDQPGVFDNDFGFEVDDRFVLASLDIDARPNDVVVLSTQTTGKSVVNTLCSKGGDSYENCDYYLFVF
jgi:hypothetical protein